QVRINLFVDGDFAGTWVKSTAHFTNIIEWGSWVHVDQKAVMNLQAPLRQQQQRQHKESSSPNNHPPHLPHPHYHYARTNNNSVPVAETASKPGPPPLTQPQHGQGREHQQEKQRRKPSFHLGAAGLAASLSGSSGAADAIAVTGTPPVPPFFSDDNRESAQPGGEKGTVTTRT